MLNAVRGHGRFARKAVEELQEAKEQLKQKDRQIDILTCNCLQSMAMKRLQGKIRKNSCANER